MVNVEGDLADFKSSSAIDILLFLINNGHNLDIHTNPILEIKKEGSDMDNPTISYINLGFSWFMVLMSIWGYTAILRNKQQSWGFWFYFGFAWALLGIYNILVINNVATNIWYMLTLQIAGYIFLVISILSLMIRAVNRDW
jgi:hypothetical protein